MTPIDEKVHVALLVRMQAGSGLDPMMVGWNGDKTRFAIRFADTRPVESLMAAAMLAGTLGVSEVVYTYEAFQSDDPDLPPAEDPAAIEVLAGFGWSADESAGWMSRLRRDDQGREAYLEPEPVEIPVAFEKLIRYGLSQSDNLDEMTNWLRAHRHQVVVYGT